MRRTMHIVICCVLLVAGARAQSFNYMGDNAMPGILRNVGLDQKLNQQIPLELVFTGDDGRARPLREYLRPGKPAVLNLVYYECPMLCTLELNGLLRAMRALEMTAGKEFDVLTVSFDPKETATLAAAKKAEYLSKYRRPEAQQGWHFLTGQQAEITALTKAAGWRYALDPATNQFAHASGIMVMTPEGKLARYLYGVEYSARDLKMGLVEASAGKIGSLADRVLLFCFHYDPKTGKYGVAILTAVRAAGILTVLGIFVFWFMMHRRERRKLQHVDTLPVIS